MKHRQKNPFKQDMQFHANALTGDKNLRIVWEKMKPGASASYNFVTNKITLPQINEVELNEQEIANLMALSYHERKHHALSDFKPVAEAAGVKYEDKKIVSIPPDPTQKIQPGKMLKTMLNFLEDCRIEMNEHYFLAGDHEDLLAYRKGEGYEKNFTDIEFKQIMNPWGMLMCMLQYKLCEYDNTIDSKIHPVLQKYFDMAWEILNDGRYHAACRVKKEGTQVMLTLSREILEKWQQTAERDPDVKRGEGSGGMGFGDMKGASEGEGEPTDGEPSDIGKEFDKDQEREGGKYAVNPNQLNDDMSEMARDKETSSDPAEEGKNKTRTRMDKVRHVDYVPYDVNDRTWVAKPHTEQYHKIRESITDKIAFLRKELTKILLCQTQDEKAPNLKTGRLDQRRLHHVINSDRLFYKKREGVKTKTAVQLVIDLSGSMNSPTGNGLTRAELAVQVATLFGETLQTLQVPFEIIGFNTSPQNSSANNKREDGYARTGDIINRWVFKTFDENFLNVRDRLGACSISMDRFDSCHTNDGGCVGGCNIDHEVILWGAARLWKQTSTRKIQIVLSDGLPSGYGHDYGGLTIEMLLQTVKKIEKSGIEVYGYGMACEAVSKFYSHHKILYNLDDMNIEALRFLSSAMVKRTIAR